MINGNYGRFTITLCNNQGAQNLSVNCYLEEAMNFMQSQCNGRRSCRIQADTFKIIKDPCPGTERYLEAHFKCTSNQDISKIPPWMVSADLHKGKKKPVRVPITAATTTTTTTKTTTSTTTTHTSTTTITITSTSTTTARRIISSTAYVSDWHDQYWSRSGRQPNRNFENIKLPSSHINTTMITLESESFSTNLRNDRIKPKTGARIRDDFAQPDSNIWTEHTMSTIPTDRVVTNKLFPDLPEDFCPNNVARNIFWKQTVKGSSSSTDCPEKSSGVALRECRDNGWGRPQLGGCKSYWIQEISAHYRNGISVKLLSNDLKHKISQFLLYGGDIISVLDLIESSVRNLNFQKLSSFNLNQDQSVTNSKVLEDFSSVLSQLLEQKSMASWMDFSNIEYDFLRTRFIGILQEVGIAVLESSNSETTLISKNFETSVISLNGSKENTGILLRTDFSTIALGVTQFLQTLTRTSPRLVLLEVTKVDTLFKINLNGQYVQHDIHKDISKRPTQLISKIVSVFAKNVKNIFMSEGLQLTLKHVALHKDTLKKCVHWDIHTNSWTTNGCSLISTNETHTTCLFKYLSTYTVIEVEEAEESMKVVVTLIASLTAIFAVTSTVIFCILCWKRIKIYDKEDRTWSRGIHLLCCVDRCRHSKARNDFYSTMSSTSSMHNTYLPPTSSSFITADHSVLEFNLHNKFDVDQYATNVKDDPGYDNQPLCQIHQTLPGYHAQYQHNYNTNTQTAGYTLRNKYLKYPTGNRIVSDLNIPRRPDLGQDEHWPSNYSSPTSDLAENTKDNSYSQVNIYAEVDPELEVDSGFTDELSDQTCDRNEDPLYNSYSNGEYYQDSVIRNIYAKPLIRDRALKVFSISKTLNPRNNPYSSDEYEDKQVVGLSLQKAREQTTGKTMTGTRLCGEREQCEKQQSGFEKHGRNAKCQIQSHHHHNTFKHN